MKHSQVPLPQVAGKLGLLNGLDVAEGPLEERICIQARDHVEEGISVLKGHAEDGKDLRASFIMLLVLIGLEGGNGAIQDVKSKFTENVYTGKSF